jgi:cation:H+ antiporter
VIILLWLLVTVVSIILMMVACRSAVHHAIALAEKTRIPPFLVGITLVAVGTDIPEIFNSIASSYLGHGDINVGDSTGSVFTQGSLIGKMPFFAGTALRVERRDAILLPGLTIVGLATGVLLMADGTIGRLDAAFLIFIWIALTTVAWRYGSIAPAIPKKEAAAGGVLRHVALALVAFAVVGGAATVVVFAIISISAAIGVPEYILSFFGASIGTSMPEMAFEYTALRRGQRGIAIGDALGSGLVDASLSVAIGPLLFPTQVTDSLVIRGAIIAIGTMLLVGTLLGVRGKLDRISGTLLLVSYCLAYVFLFPAA